MLTTGVNIIRGPKRSPHSNSQLSMLERMSAQDLQVHSQTNDESKNNKRKVTRALSAGSRTYTELLESRCDNADLCDIPNHRCLVRSPSESSFPFQSWRNGSWTADPITLQELHCGNSRGIKECRKLPSLPRRDNNKASEVKEFAPVTSTPPRRRSLCVLPDLSKGAGKRVKCRASTTLTKHQVEKVNSTFHSLESKSQNLVNWLRDQQ